MKKLARILSATLAMAMLTLSLASCTAKPASTPSSTPADTGSTSTPAAKPEEIVTLKWAAVGTGMPLNYDAWEAKLNEYLGEKIGVNIDMEVVSWGDWDNRRSVLVNASGDFDILFTNLNTFVSDVRLGAFADISELLKTSAPDLYKMIPTDYWDASSVDGKIYAIPTYKDSSQSEYFVWDKELAASAGVDPKSVKTLSDATDALKKIKEKTGKPSFPLPKEGAAWVHFEYDNMSSGLMPLGVRYDDKEAKVVSVFEQPDVMESLGILNEWYNAGYINADAATAPDPGGYKPVMMAQGWSAAAITSWGPTMGVDAEAYQWKDTVVSNDTVRGSMNCVSVNCEYPEKALQFLEAVNTDSYVRDMFYYGLEGEDWEYTADKKVHRIKTDWTMAGYTQGSFFTVTQRDDVDFNEWDEVKTLNENAKPSVLLGFNFDSKEVADKLANCTEIYMRHRGEVTTGTIDPKTGVPAMMKELRAAGFDDIVAAAQTQVDAFMAAQK